MSDQYESLSKDQLVALLRKRDGQKKLGLVWERDEIEADRAIDAEFIACAIDSGLSGGPAPWPNLVIEGDNFDALRWLRMSHAKRVKCIYIDPPYNTGNKDWVYNDHYVDKNDRWRHSTWLEFLYQRLTIARDLLADDGVILISINDDQRAILELMANEALPGMNVGSLTWRTRVGSNADHAAFLSTDHEHVLVYANEGFRFGGNEKTYDQYSNPDGDARGDWMSSDLTLGFNYKERPNLYYPLHDPVEDIWYPPNPDRIWVYASRVRLRPGQRVQTRPMEEWIERGQIAFPKEQEIRIWSSLAELKESIERGDVPKVGGRSLALREGLPNLDFWVGKRVGFGTPRFKRYKCDLRNTNQPLSSWITPKSEGDTVVPDRNMIVSGTNDEAAKVIKEVFGSKAFNYAKPVSLIRELIRQATGPCDTILDFFAGSATTAQAVMELNSEDGGERRFIMVSSTEATDVEPDKNICQQVTAERIRRLNAATEGKYAQLSAPFAYLRTREIPFEDLDYEISPAETWAALETLHDLPLTPHEPKAWQEHDGGHTVLVLVDRAEPALAERLAALAAHRPNLIVYAWAPGQVTALMGGVHIDVRPVRDTLVRHFRQ